MISNLAKSDPKNAQLQNLATRVFANTLLQAPAKNPQPGVEDEAKRRRDVDPGNGTLLLFNETGVESGYSKNLNPNGSYEPITIFPDGWDSDDGQYVDVLSLPSFSAESKDDATSAAVATTPNAKDWLDGFYDDDLWWALAWIGAYDVTQDIKYLQLAEGIFITGCKDKLRALNKDTYIQWAEWTLNWFLGSGMINKQGTINDGLDDHCNNNGRVSIYNLLGLLHT